MIFKALIPFILLSSTFADVWSDKDKTFAVMDKEMDTTFQKAFPTKVAAAKESIPTKAGAKAATKMAAPSKTRDALSVTTQKAIGKLKFNFCFMNIH